MLFSRFGNPSLLTLIIIIIFFFYNFCLYLSGYWVIFIIVGITKHCERAVEKIDSFRKEFRAKSPFSKVVTIPMNVGNSFNPS